VELIPTVNLGMHPVIHAALDADLIVYNGVYPGQHIAFQVEFNAAGGRYTDLRSGVRAEQAKRVWSGPEWSPAEALLPRTASGAKWPPAAGNLLLDYEDSC